MNIKTFKTEKEILEAIYATNDIINLFKDYSAKSNHSNIRLVDCADNHTINTANIPEDLLKEIISLCQNYYDKLLLVEFEFENL